MTWHTRILYFLMFAVLLLTHFSLPAQQRIGFTMHREVKRVEIPFEEYSNLIVIPILINNRLSVKFILDTGAESVIITEKLIGDALGLKYVRSITIEAPGIMDSLEAYVASNVSMRMPGGIEASGLNVLVLKEDYLELNNNLGEEIYGIIGHDIFRRFTVEIDYDEKKIILHRPETYKPRKYFRELDIDIPHTKPFIAARVVQEGRIDTVRLMIDTGASHAVLLDVKETERIRLPEKLVPVKIGQGLGGEIPGELGRMAGFEVADLCFRNILVSIPDEGIYLKAIKRGSRDGTIGGELLSRMHTIFDYANGKLYLAKGDKFNLRFEFDMSGLTLTAEGSQLKTLQVGKVKEGSPADLAGLQRGDEVIRINGRNLSNSTLTEIHSLLRRKDNAKIRVVLKREDEIMRVKFRLKKVI